MIQLKFLVQNFHFIPRFKRKILFHVKEEKFLIFYTNTQKPKCENKVRRWSLPQRVNYTRNFHAQGHSAIHSANRGPRGFMKVLCLSIGVPFKSHSKMMELLKREQTQLEK